MCRIADKLHIGLLMTNFIGPPFCLRMLLTEETIFTANSNSVRKYEHNHGNETRTIHASFFQGAERKTRDEERRAAKRKMTATGRKKMDELYHPATERSEFYSMSDLTKPPVLFTPAEDIDKVSLEHLIWQCVYHVQRICIKLATSAVSATAGFAFLVAETCKGLTINLCSQN